MEGVVAYWELRSLWEVNVNPDVGFGGFGGFGGLGGYGGFGGFGGFGGLAGMVDGG